VAWLEDLERAQAATKQHFRRASMQPWQVTGGTIETRPFVARVSTLYCGCRFAGYGNKWPSQ